ncbi:MAG: site-specific integrase [Rhizonema sp. NSF051]|nr:site-specific integrase [Rhizonema sp. NSF051]
MKLIPKVDSPPRHLSNVEESALVAAVTNFGNLRDQTIIVLMLHTGLRAQEVCKLHPEQVHLGKRSGILQVYGKRNKFREVPLNATARAILTVYIKTQTLDANYLFVSEKTGEALTERALGYLVKKYAHIASLTDVSPHDLRHRFGYRMAQVVPLHRLAQIMGHDSLDTTMIYIRGTQSDLQKEGFLSNFGDLSLRQGSYAEGRSRQIAALFLLFVVLLKVCVKTMTPLKQV